MVEIVDKPQSDVPDVVVAVDAQCMPGVRLSGDHFRRELGRVSSDHHDEQFDVLRARQRRLADGCGGPGGGVGVHHQDAHPLGVLAGALFACEAALPHVANDLRRLRRSVPTGGEFTQHAALGGRVGEPEAAEGVTLPGYDAHPHAVLADVQLGTHVADHTENLSERETGRERGRMTGVGDGWRGGGGATGDGQQTQPEWTGQLVWL